MEEKVEIASVLKSIKNLINETSNQNSNQDDILELTNIVEFDSHDHVKDRKKMTRSDPHQNTDLISQDQLLKNIKQLLSISTKINSKESENKISSNSIEDFLVKLIEPQIKQWLKENLPNIVNSVVEKEINKLLHNDKG